MPKILPKAILFDWDSTLAITKPAVIKALEYILACYHKPTYQELRSKRDRMKSLKDNFPLFFNEESTTAYAEYLAYYQKNCLSLITPNIGAPDFINTCIKNNIDIYIVSNKERSLLLKEVALCYPDVFFKQILAHGDAKENKPSSIPVLTALKDVTYPINEKNVWFVGDSEPDVECAKGAFVQPIIIGDNIKDINYLKQCQNSTPQLLLFKNFNELSFYLNK